MPNYNRIIIIGHLTRDPSLSYTPSQTAVVDFGIASNHKWYGQDGQQHEEVCFVDCIAFGKRAENINKYCQKGQPLLVEGRLKFDQWEAQDGTKRSKHKINVEGFTFLGQPKKQESYDPHSEKNQGQDDFDSDIPF